MIEAGANEVPEDKMIEAIFKAHEVNKEVIKFIDRIVEELSLIHIYGAGGEIGHITVRNDETETCGCGRKGCLEQYASATGLVRLTKRYFEKNAKNSILNKKEITAKEVFDAAKAGAVSYTHLDVYKRQDLCGTNRQQRKGAFWNCRKD